MELKPKDSNEGKRGSFLKFGSKKSALKKVGGVLFDQKSKSALSAAIFVKPLAETFDWKVPEGQCIKDFDDEKLDQLKVAVISKTVVKGVREVIRAINRQEVLTVYIAIEKGDSLNFDYVSCINDLIKDTEIKAFYLTNYSILRDIVMDGGISEITELRGKKVKGPKCYCAAIINHPKEK
ncbi:MAG: ribosomal L7Ae/L30e/S12e/Gadd45 family protein [archaeon]|nr:ribosomal L7Ae/L30e/S12e/Gadd45 family protein [archaeon]